METIPYRHQIIQIVRQPRDGLIPLAYAQTLQAALQRIRLTGRSFSLDGLSYVTCDVPGASGDVIRDIRPASPEEWAEFCKSGEAARYRAAHQQQVTQARERELADLMQWVDRNRTRIRALPHPIDALGIQGKTLEYCLEGMENRGTAAKLNAYRLVKSTVEAARKP